ncbi:hypothetical protein F5B20DRAFT_554196 [Whalleya microplaca]|nr:hypothetical protein F5B20DRAFT_554196 [Whalleya microplaca]
MNRNSPLFDLSAEKSSTYSTLANDLTPTHSMTSRDSLNSPQFATSPPHAETVPWPGQKFAIRSQTSGRVITLVEGELRMEDNLGEQGGWHWVCVEKNGWLGFRSPVSGTYMGHNGRGGFVAAVKHHKSYEYFCTRRHPDGGYLLLMKHGDDLWKMDVGEEGHDLIETKGDGTVWDFVKV